MIMAHDRWEYRVVVLQPGATEEVWVNTGDWELVPNSAPQGLTRRWTEERTERWFERDSNALLAAAGHGRWQTRTRSSEHSAMYVTDSIVRVYKRPV